MQSIRIPLGRGAKLIWNVMYFDWNREYPAVVRWISVWTEPRIRLSSSSRSNRCSGPDSADPTSRKLAPETCETSDRLTLGIVPPGQAPGVRELTATATLEYVVPGMGWRKCFLNQQNHGQYPERWSIVERRTSNHSMELH
jgi:hypothetical protein